MRTSHSFDTEESVYAIFGSWFVYRVAVHQSLHGMCQKSFHDMCYYTLMYQLAVSRRCCLLPTHATTSTLQDET